MKSDEAYLLDMLNAAKEASGLAAGVSEEAFKKSRLHQLAITKALEIIGEAASRVSSEYQANHPEMPWREIIGMRNRMIHGYFDINYDVVWETARRNAGELIALISPLVPPEESL
jgi:uncharacterized protein with HEPN domain